MSSAFIYIAPSLICVFGLVDMLRLQLGFSGNLGEKVSESGGGGRLPVG